MATTTIRSSSVGITTSATDDGRLLQQEQCGSFQQLNSTYNAENAIPPYTGVMFEVFAKVNMEILTLELDIRFENGVEDLSIEVYTKEGAFSAFVNDESAWEKVADTTMVPAPEGVGAIIPVEAFSTVAMPRRTKRSFYLTMKGPYIDFTAYALQKTGEIYIKGGDFDILVGSGLTEYKFPEEIDRILDPQFAGIVHYRLVSNECGEFASEATIEYRFLFGEDMEPPFFEALNVAFEDFIERSLGNNPSLQLWVEQYGLTKGGVETTSIPFSGQCPPAWPVCPTTYLATKLSLQHADTLDSGLVKFEFLKSTEAAIGAANSAGQGIQALYLGEKSISVEFTFTLAGVPSEAMDEIQQEYFSDVCRSFVDATARERYSSVLAVVIEGQTAQRYLRSGGRFMANTGSVSISGSIAGAIPAAFEPSHFKETLDVAFADGSEALISALRLGGLRPSKITGNDRISFFLDATSITPTFKEVVRPVAPETGGGSDLSNASIAMIEGAAFFVFLVAVTLGVHFYRKSQHDKLKAEARRQKRRDDKKRKHEKTDSEDTVSLLSKTGKGTHTKDADGLKSKDHCSIATSAESGDAAASGKTKSPALDPRKAPVKRTQSSPALGQGKAAPPAKPAKAAAAGAPKPVASAAKRPGLARSQSVSALGAQPAAAKGLPRKLPVKPGQKPNVSVASKPGGAPRPVLRKSLSVSALGTNGNKGNLGPTPIAAQKVVVAHANNVDGKTKGPIGRPVVQRSLSSGAKGEIVPKAGPINAALSGKPVAKPRPPIKRSLSVSALANKAPIAPNGPKVRKTAPLGANSRPGSTPKAPTQQNPTRAVTAVTKSTTGKVQQVRPALQRSLSLSAVKAKPVVGLKPKALAHPSNPTPQSAPTIKVKATTGVVRARPVIQRSLSVSAVTSNGKATSTKTPALSVSATKQNPQTTPPVLQRSLSVSAVSKKPPGATIPSKLSVASKPAGPPTTTAPAKAKAVSTLTARPAIQRSLSVSAIPSKSNATAGPSKVSANPKPAPAPASTKAPPKTGSVTVARPPIQRSLSVSAIPAKANATTGPAKASANPKLAPAPASAKAPPQKVGPTTVARRPIQRSLSVSDASGPLKVTINSKPASNAPLHSGQSKVTRPALQRSMSVSAMTAKTTQPLAKAAPPTMIKPKPAATGRTVATQPALARKPPGQRPVLKRSLSVSAVASTARKPSGATPTPLVASVATKASPLLRTAGSTPATKGRPLLKKSISVSAIGVGPKLIAAKPRTGKPGPAVTPAVIKKPTTGVAVGKPPARPTVVRTHSVSG